MSNTGASSVKPCERFTAPCSTASRVIRRITVSLTSTCPLPSIGAMLYRNRMNLPDVPITHRTGRKTDAPFLARMARDYVEDGLRWTWRPRRIQRMILDPGATVRVAEAPRGPGTEIAGFAIMRFELENAHLSLLAVHPSYRRRNNRPSPPRVAREIGPPIGGARDPPRGPRREPRRPQSVHGSRIPRDFVRPPATTEDASRPCACPGYCRSTSEPCAAPAGGRVFSGPAGRWRIIRWLLRTWSPP